MQLRVPVSEKVMLIMNEQTAVPYYYDIETSYTITIDKDGNSSMKSYINQAGKKRGNIFFKMQKYFKSEGSQKWETYFPSKDGEGTTIEGENILGSGNIDEILGLIKDLSSIQEKTTKKAMNKKISDIHKKIKKGVEGTKFGVDLEGRGEDIYDEGTRSKAGEENKEYYETHKQDAKDSVLIIIDKGDTSTYQNANRSGGFPNYGDKVNNKTHKK